ncbi:hypothetical protein CU097_004394, partial [Rhizopus azygosporus]
PKSLWKMLVPLGTSTKQLLICSLIWKKAYDQVNLDYLRLVLQTLSFPGSVMNSVIAMMANFLKC